MNIQNFFKLSYWFSLQTPVLSKTALIIFCLIYALALAAAIMLRYFAPRLKNNLPLGRFFQRLSHPLIFLGIAGFVFLFFRQEGASLLSSRFLVILIFASAIFWKIWVVVKFLKSYKNDLTRLAKDREFRKYLPH